MQACALYVSCVSTSHQCLVEMFPLRELLEFTYILHTLHREKDNIHNASQGNNLPTTSQIKHIKDAKIKVLKDLLGYYMDYKEMHIMQ